MSAESEISRRVNDAIARANTAERVRRAVTIQRAGYAVIAFSAYVALRWSMNRGLRHGFFNGTDPRIVVMTATIGFMLGIALFAVGGSMRRSRMDEIAGNPTLQPLLRRPELLDPRPPGGSDD